MTESIQDKVTRWRAAAKTGPCWPLVLAKEVCDLADHWDQYKADTVDDENPNGKSPTRWLRDVFGDGHGLGWWRRRLSAVNIMGEWARRSVDHEVAVWFVQAVPEDKRKEAGRLLITGCRENGDNPLTKQQAIRRLAKLIGRNSRPRQPCARCAQLEEMLIANGINPDGEIPAAAE